MNFDIPLCRKTLAIQQILFNVQMSSSHRTPNLIRLWEGGSCSRHKGIHLEEVRSLHTSLQIFKVFDLTQVPSAYTLTAYHHFPLDDLMQFTCVQQPQRLYCHRLHTVIGICFWFCLERIIIVFHWYYGSREKCKSSLTLHQSTLPPGPENITIFIIVTTQSKKSLSAVKSTTGGIFILRKKMNVFREFTIYFYWQFYWFWTPYWI